LAPSWSQCQPYRCRAQIRSLILGILTTPTMITVLRRRGVEICYRLFDAGKSLMAVAHLILISCQCPRSSKGRCLLPDLVLLPRLVNDCSPRLLHFGAADRALRPWRQDRLAAERAPGRLRSFPARSTSSMRLTNANRILTKESLLGHLVFCLFDAVLNRSIRRRRDSRIQGRG
jgi:hypothetical protein